MSKQITTYSVSSGSSGVRWDVSISDTNNQSISVGGSSFTVNYPTVMVTRATNVGIKRLAQVNFSAILKTSGGSTLWTLPMRSPADTQYTWTSIFTQGAANQIYRRSDITDGSKTYQTSSFFNTTNPNARSVTLNWRLQLSANGLASTDSSSSPTVLEVAPSTEKNTTWNVTISLNAPPTFDSTQVSFDTPYVYAGYTTASVNVSNLSAKYGGNISSAVLTIGNQTATRTTNGTLSIALNKGGTFTPTVKVTDSRGQVTTKTLNEITVNTYVAPSTSFSSIERTDASGEPRDEGTNAVATAKFNWTEAVALLSAPTLVATDPNGLSVAVTTAWYSARESDGTFDPQNIISDWSDVVEKVSVYCLIYNYRLTQDTSVVSGKKYYIRTGSGTEQDPYVYTEVSSPSGSPVQQGWYEIGAFDTQYSYQITLTPNDVDVKSVSHSGTTITKTLGSAFYTVDFLAGGHGIAFGQACQEEGFFCNMDAHFADKTGRMRALFDFFYPVGSYYETSDTTFDPNYAWGGTWVKDSPGRVTVSQYPNDTNFGSVGDTGGATTSATENHTLTAAQSGIRAHGHGMAHTHGTNNSNYDRYVLHDSSNTNGILRRAIKNGTGTEYTGMVYSTTAFSRGSSTGASSKSTVDDNTASNATQAHNHGSVSTLQPYIVVNRWHRTA